MILRRSSCLKSPVLSPKSPAIYENYKSGCAWGFIHCFDFAKLIPMATSFPITSALTDKIKDAVIDKNVAVNSRKREVKKIMKEGVSVKHQTMKENANGELQNQQFNPKLVGHSKEPRKARGSLKNSCRFTHHSCDAVTKGFKQPSDKKMVEKSSNNNLASVPEASYNDEITTNGGDRSCKNIGGRKHDNQAKINVQVNMNEAIEAFINQKLTDGESLCRNEVANRSNEFICALEVLSSNKDQFMKLLQDPNSLLVKHIQDLRDSHAKIQQHRPSSKAKTSYDHSVC
ncbi:Acid-amino acid ligase, isoform 1 [Hibiscus syriacus]|uniref:Acid-amino acid ligase, isoform 1 n=1 Tax=Hibiscus syriacus TaxID=106335 RepID=A0A6A3B7A3_HIBSY|nr:Acid-amino acid ligase, isoform 1 [Hibiscus syriacus]